MATALWDGGWAGGVTCNTRSDGAASDEGAAGFLVDAAELDRDRFVTTPGMAAEGIMRAGAVDAAVGGLGAREGAISFSELDDCETFDVELDFFGFLLLAAG